MFFFLAQTEQGDIFKITLETEDDMVWAVLSSYVLFVAVYRNADDDVDIGQVLPQVICRVITANVRLRCISIKLSYDILGTV